MKSLRPWATPLTIATTLVTLLTGVLLFFHSAPGLTRISHEWIGMVMVAAVVAHLILNWRAFTTYFKRPAGLALIALGVVATAATFAISPGEAARGASPMAAIMRTMGNAEIEDIAALAHRETAEVLAALSAAGADAQATDTLAALAEGDRGRQMDLLQTILGE